VTLLFRLAGRISDFAPPQREAIRRAIAEKAGVDAAAVSVALGGGAEREGAAEVTAAVSVDVVDEAAAERVREALSDIATSPAALQSFLENATGEAAGVLGTPTLAASPQAPQAVEDEAATSDRIVLLVVASLSAALACLLGISCIFCVLRRRQLDAQANAAIGPKGGVAASTVVKGGQEYNHNI